MTAYYNENDDFASDWLRELIKDNLIPYGVVDNRSIEDIIPNELKDFNQCHFFAGIGVWPLAFRLAGWPDDRPVWSGSCPCQPFSAAGKGIGFDDERHLWPHWYHNIENAKSPDIPVFGEQVASKTGRAWFDLVSSDMERLDHACGAVDTCAAGAGAPSFIGQRLYWLATTRCKGYQGWGGTDYSKRDQNRQIDQSCSNGGLAATDGGEQRFGNIQPGRQHRLFTQSMFDSGNSGISFYPVDFWRNAEWLFCRDPDGPRFRPVEPGSFPLVDARSLFNRLDEVRGAGNALNVAQAWSFIKSAMEIL